MTLRTTLRETCKSRQIALIVIFREKYARGYRLHNQHLEPSLPSNQEACVDPYPRGPDWMPITPKMGSLFHADSHPGEQPTPGAPWRIRLTHDVMARFNNDAGEGFMPMREGPWSPSSHRRESSTRRCPSVLRFSSV